MRSSNNQGAQTERVKEALLCLIRDRHLRSGDRLPSQAVLRQELGVGSVTIQRAIESLKEAGILETLPQRGVKVCNPESNGMLGRQIGLVCAYSQKSPTHSTGLHCLQVALREEGCQCRLFLRKTDCDTIQDSLDYFDGLRRCIEKDELDGLLTAVTIDDEGWSLIHRHSLPVLSLGSAHFNPGWRIHGYSYYRSGLDVMSQRGYRHPALISYGFPITEELHGLCREFGILPLERYCRLLNAEFAGVTGNDPVRDGVVLREILKDFQDMPPSLRPDCLVVMDDFLANACNTFLLQMRLGGSDWQPDFIYLSHRQNPLFFSGMMKGVRLEIDAMAHARQTVNLLLDIITGRETTPREFFLQKPKIISQDS